MSGTFETVARRLTDERSRKVIFVSHCILNENTRYLGGAFTRGALTHLVSDIAGKGYGIVQMPCPEQLAWGGVHKRLMWLSLPSRSAFIERMKARCFFLFALYTQYVYRRLARRIAQEMADYRDSGYEIVGVVGIDGSPSCGVRSTLDLRKSFLYFSSLGTETMQRESFNRNLYQDCLRQGRGLFTIALEAQCQKRGIELKYFSHDLVAEMRGTAAESLENL
jgi:predicted secreted protein